MTSSGEVREGLSKGLRPEGSEGASYGRVKGGCCSQSRRCKGPVVGLSLGV